MADKLIVPRPSDIRDAILRVDRSGLIRRGVTNPNVTAGSDYFVRAESLAQQLTILYANQQARADQTMPDTAEDEDLTRILNIYRLYPRAAQPSAGPVVLVASAATFIATGTQLIDSEGQVFEVSVGGSYANGADVPIIALSTGVATNHPQGTPLRWSPAPAYADSNALVGVGGLIGGADTDTNETSRNRLYTYFRNPPQGGNWSQIAQWATDASASVQACYVYPALNGPSTFGICVLGPLTYDSTNGWSRAVSDTVLNIVSTYVAARHPPHADLVATTPKFVGFPNPNVATTVSIGMSIPLAIPGGGSGGGWTDAVPWPALAATGSVATYVSVSAVTSSTVFTLTSDDAGNCPSTVGLDVGQTQIAWFSNAQYAAGEDPIIIGTVTAVSGTTGALQVTVSVPFTGIAVGDLVMPASENIQTYARAFLTAMNDMGPGQWTSNANVLIHAKRRPLVTASNPSDFTSTLLRAITSSGDEVLDVDYLYRSFTTPGVPSNTTIDSPFCLVPGRVAFYDKIL